MDNIEKKCEWLESAIFGYQLPSRSISKQNTS